MERAIRRTLTVAHLGLFAAGCLLAATSASLLVELSVSPPISPRASTRIEGGRDQPSPAPLQLDQLSRVTGIPLRSDAEAGHGQDPGRQPTRTSLRIKLLGTLLSSRTGWSLASVLDLGRQRTSTVMVGDQVQDARVLEILRDRVIIDRDGRREFFGVEPGDGVLGPLAESLTRTLPIRPLDENHYEVPRSEVDRALRNLDELWVQARVAPAYRDGRPEGFKLFAIRPDSLFSRLGLVNGDVIKRINGFEMTTPENALEVYARLRDASRIDVELEREGSAIRKTYGIR